MFQISPAISAETIIPTAPLRQKLQINAAVSPSHNNSTDSGSASPGTDCRHRHEVEECSATAAPLLPHARARSDGRGTLNHDILPLTHTTGKYTHLGTRTNTLNNCTHRLRHRHRHMHMRTQIHLTEGYTCTLLSF